MRCRCINSDFKEKYDQPISGILNIFKVGDTFDYKIGKISFLKDPMDALKNIDSYKISFSKYLTLSMDKKDFDSYFIDVADDRENKFSKIL